MKKVIIGILLGIFLLLVVPAGATLAQGDESAVDVDEEETFLPSPSSPFYFLQTWREQFEELTARTPEAKAEVALKHARRRLMEMEQLATEDPEKAEELLARWQERYEEKIQAAEERAAAAGEKKEQVEQRIIEKRQEHLQRLEQVQEKAPEQAKSALQRAIDKQTESLEQWMKRFPKEGEMMPLLQKLEQKLENRLETQEENQGEETMIRQEAQEQVGEQENQPETGQYVQEQVREQDRVSQPEVGEEPTVNKAQPVAPRQMQVRGAQTENPPAGGLPQQLWNTVVSWFE